MATTAGASACLGKALARAAAGSIDRVQPYRREGDMQRQDQIETDRPQGVLAGARAWIITDGKAGMVVQCKGVADALGLDYEMKCVKTRGIWRALPPWGPVQPADRPGRPGACSRPRGQRSPSAADVPAFHISGQFGATQKERRSLNPSGSAEWGRGCGSYLGSGARPAPRTQRRRHRYLAA